MHPFKSLAANLDLMFTSRNENKPNEALFKMFSVTYCKLKFTKRKTLAMETFLLVFLFLVLV